MAFVLAARLQYVLDSLISHDQTAYRPIKNRYMGYNIRLIEVVIDHFDKLQMNGVMFFADFQKAFASLPYEKVPWYSHGATMVYHGKQWYTMVRCNCTMVQITCTMVDYGIPWYILTVPWHILVQPWFTELVPWCIMIYHGTSLHNHSTIYL